MIDGYSGFTPIGHGGFSTVYLAYQEIFDRQVAVKVLHANLSDPDAQRRFVRECRATGRLTGHPHVVTVFDAGATDDRRPYLAMEYFPAGSLAARLKDSGPIDVPTAVTTGVAVADALDAAHRADILHRDLKPANILLRAPNHPVLSDFGIASLDFGPDADTVSAAFTLGYAAPEVLLGEEPTRASDVFALGATLFALLQGTPPYPGRAPAQVLFRILEHGPEPLDRDDVPVELDDLLARMLDREPAHRPASAAQVVDELRALPRARPARQGAQGRPARATPSPPPRTPAPTRSNPRKRSRWIWGTAALGLLAVLAVVVGVVLLRPDPGSGSVDAGPGNGSPTETSPTETSPTETSSPTDAPTQSTAGCVEHPQSVIDYQAREYASRYVCPTYVSESVYANVRTSQATESLDDSGWMYESPDVWVICQLEGRPNPVELDNTNTWWLYTQGDEPRDNAYGYTERWGYLPATAVELGGQNEQVPGVPVCDSYL